jgi:hypothetical protein
LAGKTHELARYDWGPMSMGRVIDTLNGAMGEIYKTPSLILDEKHMMTIFKEYLQEIPPSKYIGMNYCQKGKSLLLLGSQAPELCTMHDY